MQYGYFDDGANEYVITRPFVYKPLIGTSTNWVAGQLARIAKHSNPGNKRPQGLMTIGADREALKPWKQ